MMDRPSVLEAKGVAKAEVPIGELGQEREARDAVKPRWGRWDTDRPEVTVESQLRNSRADGPNGKGTVVHAAQNDVSHHDPATGQAIAFLENDVETRDCRSCPRIGNQKPGQLLAAR